MFLAKKIAYLTRNIIAWFNCRFFSKDSRRYLVKFVVGMAQFGYQFIECIKKIQYALYWVFSYHTGVMYNGHCSWTYSLNILVLEPTTLLVCDIIRWKDFEAYSESCFSGTTLGYSFIGFLVKLWKQPLFVDFALVSSLPVLMVIV